MSVFQPDSIFTGKEKLVPNMTQTYIFKFHCLILILISVSYGPLEIKFTKQIPVTNDKKSHLHI